MIGLITINDYSNLGNRLQNYAMMQILSRYDDTYNIVRYYGCEKKIVRTKNPVVITKKVILKIFNKLEIIIKFLFKNRTYHYEQKRKENFLKFNNLIKNGEELSYNTDYEKLNEKYDYFVVGSDQVWNPNFPGNGMYINMLGFAKFGKKIAVSPSISIEKLDKEQEEEFTKYLVDFNMLSCREQKGSDLVSRLTGRDCETLIDPTLMLSENEWQSVEKKPEFHNDTLRYILLYFLGSISEENKKIIERIASKYKLAVIDVYDKESIYYSCGPSEFIYLVHHCSLMLTNSFHGTVFSYIFNKPVRTFKRFSTKSVMNSRIENLISKLKLNNSIFITDDYKDFDNLLDVTYDKSILLEEQEKFKLYLNKAFDVVI